MLLFPAAVARTADISPPLKLAAVASTAGQQQGEVGGVHLQVDAVTKEEPNLACEVRGEAATGLMAWRRGVGGHSRVPPVVAAGEQREPVGNAGGALGERAGLAQLGMGIAPGDGCPPGWPDFAIGSFRGP